jgi:glycosyltransferase involved in cell wall biosynthesis
MQPNRTIVFIINSLTTGGAEHALVGLLADLEDHLKPYRVHLILLDVEKEMQSVPPWVQRHFLDAKFSLFWSTASLIRLLIDLKPAVTISFLNRSNCANIISSKILKYPCIISERTHASSRFGSGLSSILAKAIMRFTYPYADQVIANSEGVREDLITKFGVDPARSRVIYNRVDADRICERALEEPSISVPMPYIVSAGRLTPSKNFRLLIQSYASSGIVDNLVILGEGEERKELERLVSRYGLEGRVVLPGHIQNPYPIIRRARIFVSSSKLEGFPNALIEAMALGCPVVAADCDTGPMEILTGKMQPRCTDVILAEYGILVPVNSAHLLSKAIRVCCCDNVSMRYSELSKKRARDFTTSLSTEQYWSIIASYVYTG